MTKIPPDGCFVALSSFRRVKRGKNTSEVTLWQEKFEVPVFKTSETDAEESAPQTFHSEFRPSAPVKPTRAERTGTTGREFYFDAARDIPGAVGISILAVIWGGIWGGVLLGSDAPVMFPIM